MQDSTERATQMKTDNVLRRALRTIRNSDLDSQMYESLRGALIVSYFKWEDSHRSTCEALQMEPSTTSAISRVLQAIWNSGLNLRAKISLTSALIAGYNNWLSQQFICEAGSRCGSK